MFSSEGKREANEVKLRGSGELAGACVRLLVVVEVVVGVVGAAKGIPDSSGDIEV